MYCEHGSNLSCFPFPLAVGEETFRLFSVIMTATTYILGASKLDSSLDLPISRPSRSVNSKCAHFVVREDSWNLNVSLASFPVLHVSSS